MTESTSPTRVPDRSTGHAGELAVAVARAHGVETMFTLSGAHVFPMYDGAVKADPPMRLLDVRHEQTAAFAAEATGKLTRVPGLAVLTAGPGVTNGRQRDRAGPVRRLADGRRRRPGAGQPLGQRQPPGARPAADHRADLEVGPHPPHRRRRARRLPRGVHCGRVAPPRPGLRRRPDGRVLQLRVGHAARPPAASRGAEPDPDALGEVAELLAGASPAGAGARHRRVGRRRRGGRAPLRRGRRHPGHHQRHGPRRRPRRPPAAGHQGPRPGARRRRPGRRRRHPARLPARLRRLRRQGRRARRPRSCTSPTPPARSPATPTSRRRSRGDLTAVLDGLLAGARAGRTPARLVRLGRRPAGHRRPPPSSATPRCSAPRPTRSTPPASTASWCRGWPTTRS